MSIWGTLIGGMLGFTIGGPIGALLGSFLGSKFSGGKVKSINFSNENSQQIFALALIILSAKISKADGIVTKDELLAIKEKLNIPDSEIDNVSKVFNVAKQDDLGFEPYAQQICQIYSKNKTALVEVLNILLYIAEADGEVSESEIKMIREIGFIFNLSDISNRYHQIGFSSQENNTVFVDALEETIFTSLNGLPGSTLEISISNVQETCFMVDRNDTTSGSGQNYNPILLQLGSLKKPTYFCRKTCEYQQ